LNWTTRRVLTAHPPFKCIYAHLFALNDTGADDRRIYALLLAWSDYLHPSVLLAVRNMTLAVTRGQLFADVDAPWNAMMTAAIIYVLPPIALLFALRRHFAAGLTMADVTG